MKEHNKHNEGFIRQKIGDNSGFSVPNYYLENLENDLLSKLSEEKLSKENGFNVPENYFSTVEDNVMAKMSSEGKIIKVISISKTIKKLIPYASVACIVLFVGFYFFNNQNTSFEDVSIADIESWYEQGYGDSSNAEIAMVLEISDFNDNEINLSSIPSEDIDNYIDLIDNSSLILETQN